VLCTIWDFHGGDYEECRLLGYKYPVRTSQETHYGSTEPSLLVLCKIWGFHGGDYEEYHLPGYKNPVRTSQETHYVSATERSQLMLCKIWGFHGSHYEECRLLGYKNPVPTSQETHYVSATDSSLLILCTRFSQQWLRRMPSCRVLRHVALVRIDVSEERSVCIIRVTRIDELGTTLAASSNWCTLWRNTYLVDSCHPDDGGVTFLWSVGSYNSHRV
jgi:hypothetical protein